MPFDCPRCHKDHANERFEFVHVIDRFGHSLRREPGRTIGALYAEFGDDKVQVTLAPVGRLPAPHMFGVVLNETETLVGVIPSDEYLHEEIYPIEVPGKPGFWMTSNGRLWNAGNAAFQYEMSRDTPIAHLLRTKPDPRAHPELVLAALISAVDPKVWAKLSHDLRATPANEKVPLPWPYSTDEGQTFQFSTKERLSVKDLLWEVETEARQRRRETVLERALKDAAGT